MTGYENDPTYQLDHGMEPTETITHRGATIEPNEWGDGYYWEHPNYVDCDYTGDSPKYTGCGHGSTIDDCIESIDEFLDEIESK